jgi:hypothetical protein
MVVVPALITALGKHVLQLTQSVLEEPVTYSCSEGWPDGWAVG